ncbi:hypothetical protein [sabeidhel virus 1]|uniref:Uncharacterized protein n=1 Tax=sabeidhel virus 1 TaxID=2992925 RepID=A0A9E7VB17_9VIRU|nr:hypothetical protein [sabeidhel virus 1]
MSALTKQNTKYSTLLYRKQDFWTRLHCHQCQEEFWHLTTFYCKDCRKCRHGKLNFTKKGCELCSSEARKEAAE